MSSAAYSSGGKYKPFNQRATLRLNNSIGWNNYKTSQSRANLSVNNAKLSPRESHNNTLNNAATNMNTMDRNITSSSIMIGGSSAKMIPTKARPKTGVNRLSVRSRRAMLVKQP